MIRNIYPEKKIFRKAPKNLRPEDAGIFGAPDFSYTVPSSALCRLRNVHVTDIGIIIKNLVPQKKFISCYEVDFRRIALRYTVRSILKMHAETADPTKKHLLIYDHYAGPKGFFHWISDCLTRLVELNEELSDYTVLLPWYFKNERIYNETLALFNVGEKRYIEKDSRLRVSELYACEYIAPSGNYHPANVRKLKHFVWAKLGLAATGVPPTDKVYISRGKSTRRFVLNEAQVIEVMSRHGFRVVYLEDLDFAAQVKLIHQTRYLVSIHGAALTHIHFMQENTSVLEFRREQDHINGVYYALADASGVNYFYQSCPAILENKKANRFNLEVDIEELEKNIRLMCNTH